MFKTIKRIIQVSKTEKQKSIFNVIKITLSRFWLNFGFRQSFSKTMSKITRRTLAYTLIAILHLITTCKNSEFFKNIVR